MSSFLTICTKNRCNCLIVPNMYDLKSSGRPILKMIQYNKVVTEREWLEIAVCIAERGWPNPSISWWRNGSRIRDGDNHYSYNVVHKSTGVLRLKIRYIQGYHQGTYTCRADNIFGTSTEDINVIVKRK